MCQTLPSRITAPADIFEEGMTLHQLRCCGVLEVARIARAGFPTRYTHQVPHLPYFWDP